MTLFEYINQNFERVKHEVKTGQRPCSTIRYIQIYSRYDYWRKLDNSVSRSVLFTSEDMKIGERSIYNIIKKMESEI